MGTAERRRAVALASVAALGLAACAASGRASGRAAAHAAASTPEIEIGFLGPLSGPGAQLGTGIERGEKLAVARYDARGPRRPVAVDVFDSGGNPSRAGTGATRLIEDGDVAVVGPALDQEAAVAGPIFERAGLPDVSASATGADLARHGWRFFHRVVADDGAQGRGDGDYLFKVLGDRTVGVVDDGSAYGVALTAGVTDQVDADGGSVVVGAHVDPASAGYGPTIGRIVAARADAVFYGGYYDAAGRLVEQLRAAGYRGAFMSGDGSDDPAFITDAGGVPGTSGGPAEGAYLSCACADETQSPAGTSFVSAYTAMFATVPAGYSAEAYDATNFVLAAVGSGATTGAAVNRYLASKSYRGITKTIRFLPDGDLAGAKVYVYQVRGGRITEIGTTG